MYYIEDVLKEIKKILDDDIYHEFDIFVARKLNKDLCEIIITPYKKGEEDMKILHVRITDRDLEILNNGGQLDRIIDNVFLKIYRSNYEENHKE